MQFPDDPCRFTRCGFANKVSWLESIPNILRSEIRDNISVLAGTFCCMDLRNSRPRNLRQSTRETSNYRTCDDRDRMRKTYLVLFALLSLILVSCSFDPFTSSTHLSREESTMTSQQVTDRIGTIAHTVEDGIAPPEPPHIDSNEDYLRYVSRRGCLSTKSGEEGPPWYYTYSRNFEYDPVFVERMNDRLADFDNNGWEIRRRLDSNVGHPKWILVKEGFTINFSAPSSEEMRRTNGDPTQIEDMNVYIAGPCVTEA